MRKNLLVPLALCVFLWPAHSTGTTNIYGQQRAEPRMCSDIPGQTSATHRFRQVRETIAISIRGEGVPARVADCDPVVLDLQWSNGRNNGSNFTVTFLDSNNRPIHRKPISGFQNGLTQFPLSSFESQAPYGSSMGLISVPTTVTIQAVPPFAAPASISYRVVRAPRPPKSPGREEEANHGTETAGNEIVGIRDAVRLIGSSRVPLVQIELRTTRPVPVSDVPLQLQVGNKIFIDELTGDYSGRKLTLTLTPDMYAELNEGDEITAFLGKPDRATEREVWHFGKLKKH